MSVSSTEGVTSPFTLAGTQPATNADGTTAAATDDKQMFLELMVTQLRYQDPLNPTDSSEFLAQSAQFTALEKMQAVADQTAMLASSQLAFGATSLVGRTVTWLDAEGAEHTGSVTGATFGAAGPTLTVGGEEVPLFNILSVAQAGTATSPDTSTSTDSESTTGPPQDGTTATATDGEPTTPVPAAARPA